MKEGGRESESGVRKTHRTGRHTGERIKSPGRRSSAQRHSGIVKSSRKHARGVSIKSPPSFLYLSVLSRLARGTSLTAVRFLRRVRDGVRRPTYIYRELSEIGPRIGTARAEARQGSG